MRLEGGHWLWTASLRYGWMLVLLCLWLDGLGWDRLNPFRVGAISADAESVSDFDIIKAFELFYARFVCIGFIRLLTVYEQPLPGQR